MHIASLAARQRCTAASTNLQAPPQQRFRQWVGAQRCRRRFPRVTQVAQASLQEWDIVLYKSADGAAALGRVSQLAADEVSLERLEEDAVNLVWRVSYDAEQRVPLSSVWRKVEADYMQLCDPDRVSNPHGEHALEVYRLLEPVAEALQAASQAE